ncbi:MAG: plasmid stabilization protein [Flavobacteriaceae bacterium]|nr:MAG: plasmid stabilization protein [Flavobacteriaceae bacterium]
MTEENNYLLSVRASEDIRGIARFSIEKFGILQADIYRKGLTSFLNNLGNTPEIGREYIAIKRHMLSRFRFKAHSIFYHSIDKRIFIVRILGNKMSFIKHLESK